jgi:hypothetical protein
MGVICLAIEINSNLVADIWQSRSTKRSATKPIFCDIESKSLDFISLSLDYVNHEANLLAHACAKEAFSGFHQNLRMNVIPNFLCMYSAGWLYFHEGLIIRSLVCRKKITLHSCNHF